MSKIIWTPEIRRHLYAAVMAEFGPCKTWKKPLPPKEVWLPFIERMATGFTALTGESFTPSGVEMQVRWGLTTQKTVQGRSHVSNYLRNVACALESGLVDRSHLPKTLQVSGLEL